ncbi:hypothetical protein NQ318_023491 [Aromia moschata]|uniref:Tc1-like transposase DDE domain-containing protein n=1 Tax=Aromia moschata TaxID=1265417 RepID=A0AAV8YNS5_9CUCU|nr:hypothetical protein NQ318_023491 [Aromia moschata]
MPGKRLNSQAREIVAKLLNYFMAEKENLGPLISVNAVQQRVADALGISLRTVCSIKTSPKIPEASTNIKYKPLLKSKTDDLPEGHKVEVRNVIYNMYAENSWSFWMKLGYSQKGNQTKSWQDESKKSVRKPEGYEGKRFIVLHAGSNKRFVDKAGLIYSTKSKLADYHGDMNADIFMKWLEEKLIPNLMEPSLIIMDNASYHSIQVERQPTTSWNKPQIIEWLEKSNITYTKDMFKTQLLNIAKQNQKPTRYKVDECLQRNGHEVLRLPPYHCQFNGIEMIWANAKNFYNAHIGEDGYGDDKVLAMWEKSLQNCTPEVWLGVVKHTEKVIEEWYNREHILDNIPQIIINVNDDESDLDSE